MAGVRGYASLAQSRLKHSGYFRHGGSCSELCHGYCFGMKLTYEYRLLPTKQQHRALQTLLESQRQLYNAALEERIGAYKRGIRLSYFDQTKSLTEWRRTDTDALAVPANLQRATLKRLDDAFLSFWGRLRKGLKAGTPRFRGKGWWHSFGFREFSGISLNAGRLRFKGMPAGLRVHLHRPLPQQSPILCCIFSRDTKGWKVGFSIDVAAEHQRTGERVVGIDLGLRTFAAFSDGGFIPGVRAARRTERKLRLLQRALARKRKGSRGRLKAKRDVARCFAGTQRVRNNFLHQASSRVIRDYDEVAVEALHVNALARSALARDVNDASWSRFLAMLGYKAERAGVRVSSVDPRKTSQECSACGQVVPKDLSERVHDCPACGLVIDRDLNAAINILHRAGAGPDLRNVAGCDMRAGGNLNQTATLDGRAATHFWKSLEEK